jgi:hypothetical protein
MAGELRPPGIKRQFLHKVWRRRHDADNSCAGQYCAGRRFAEALRPPQHCVFQTPPYDAEGVANRYLHGVALLARSRIVIDVDNGAAFNRKPDT